VLAAGEAGAAGSAEALARLCALYWYPVFAFVRRQGHATEEAEDLTQGFFARLIEKGDLADADRTRGRFRSFLLTACQHYLSNERDRASAQKRGGGVRLLSIDLLAAEGRYDRALAHAETPERLFDRQWCLTLLAGVLDDLRQDYEAAGRVGLFERVKPFLTEGERTETYADAGLDLSMTGGAVKVAVHRLRQRYRRALRQRVADTVASPEEVDEEIAFLLATLAGPGTRP
jgi:DNA-directed RNA polymerase specialized sigma24 family protein